MKREDGDCFPVDMGSLEFLSRSGKRGLCFCLLRGAEEAACLNNVGPSHNSLAVRALDSFLVILLIQPRDQIT